MRLFLIFSLGVFILTSSSCRRNGGDERALRICNCYDQIHSESVLTNDEVELQKKVDACNELFSNTLSTLDANEKEAFMKAYRECQEN